MMNPHSEREDYTIDWPHSRRSVTIEGEMWVAGKYGLGRICLRLDGRLPTVRTSRAALYSSRWRTGMVPVGQSALSASVLVLNRYYMAVHVINVRRALGLLCRELAEVIHFEEGQYANYNFESWREISALRAELKDQHDDWIRGINFDLQAPRVVRLLFYDRVPRQSLRFNRRNLFARDGNLCQYCGKTFPTSELSLDHVMPRSRGGDTSWENVVCACVACNVRKGGRTPQEAHMKLIRHPAKPKRSPLLSVKLDNPKYESWKSFVDAAYWTVDLK